MLTHATSFSRTARSTSERCPRCNAPIVGTYPIVLPRARSLEHQREAACGSGNDRIIYPPSSSPRPAKTASSQEPCRKPCRKPHQAPHQAPHTLPTFTHHYYPQATAKSHQDARPPNPPPIHADPPPAQYNRKQPQ